MENNIQAHKWMLVINNPQVAKLDHKAITERLQQFNPTCFCMADEIAATGTYRTHAFFCSTSPVRFSTIKNCFPTAHIEQSYNSLMVLAVLARHGVSLNTTIQRKFAALPIMVTRTVSASTLITVKMFWYLKNFTARFPSGLC